MQYEIGLTEFVGGGGHVTSLYSPMYRKFYYKFPQIHEWPDKPKRMCDQVNVVDVGEMLHQELDQNFQERFSIAKCIANLLKKVF